MYEEMIKIIPSVLWVLFAVALAGLLRGQIKSVLDSIVLRIKSGAAVKFSVFEMGAVQVAPFTGQHKASGLDEVERDDGTFDASREELRRQGVFLVHKLSPSSEAGMLYDVLIYLVPSLKYSSLAKVAFVEYYFGTYWNKNVFRAVDRSTGFAIATTAFAPFTCSARLRLNDGTETIMHRFVDFEMGAASNGR